MSDNVTQTINVVATQSGMDAVLKKVRGLQEAIDKQTKSGNVNAAGQKALSKQAQGVETAFKGMATGAKVATGAVASNTAATQALASTLPRLRYALYDVSTTFAIAGAALLALGVATTAVSIKMDREFADVIRTTSTYLDQTGEASRNLRKDFNDLFASMPSSWGDLTEIGTLAGQLGVASENVAEFTRLVTMIASTTDATVEASATAIGRLSQLLSVSADEYENLGSAILSTGTASVATESQIIKTSSEIASMGAYAGMSADQVIGFSSTLASLGVQPQLSRGTITRLFTKISVAIAEGSDKLGAFGAIAGQTGEQFAQAWGQDASGALERMFAGLSKVEGSGAVTTLNELGITSARDVPTILKLAQNHEFLSEQLDISAKGYAEAGSLQEQYGVIAETVASKLTVLKNNVQLYMDAIGGGASILGPLIDALSKFAEIMTKMAKNPVNEFLSTMFVTTSILAGVFLIAAAGMARFGASAAALVTAKQGLIDVAVAMGVVATEAEAAAMSTNRLSIALVGAAQGTHTLSRGIKALKIATGFGIALVALDLLWALFDKADESVVKFTGDITGLNEALAGDTKAALEGAGNSVAEFTQYVRENGQVLTDSEAAIYNNARANAVLRGDLEDVSTSVQEQITYVGELTQAWLANQITTGGIGSALIDDFSSVQSVLAGMGTTLEATLKAALTPDTNDGPDFGAYIAGLTAEVERYENALVDAKINAQGAFTIDGRAFQDVYDYKAFVQDQITANEDLKASAEGVKEIMFGLYEELRDAASAAETTKAINDALNGLGDAGIDAWGALKTTLSVITDIADEALNTESALATLGKGLQAGGLDWSQYTDAGRTNLGNLYAAIDSIVAASGSGPAAAADMQALFNMLIQGGYASRAELAPLLEQISLLTNGEGAKSSGRDMSSFFNAWSTGADKAAKSTKSAAKEVRTLKDYASDLAKVWGRAFEIRYDSILTYDKITSSFQKIRDAADEAAQNIADLNREIAGLQTDVGTLEYFLGVAVNYGDTLRQAEIQKELADVQAKLANKQQDLTKEQSANSKVLTGNSEAAIENRKTMTDLVKEYEDHIGALAESGKSQAELAIATKRLKQDFIDQATALGYARADIDKYAKAFDDVSTAIARVPRNITVTANADPAIQAFNELEDSINKARSSASAPITLGKINNPNVAKELRRAALEGQIAALLKQLTVANAYGARTIGNALYGAQRKLYTGQYYDGGYTGQGGKYDPAGTVHKGEYVVPKKDVNQSTGMPYADAMNRLSRGTPGRTGYAGGGFVSGGFDGRVSLSASSIQQLAHVLQTQVVIGGKVLAGVVNGQNAESVSKGGY